MKVQRFHDHELYLLNNWESAMSLESSMKAVRSKYEQIFAAALDKIEQQHKELDSRTIHLSYKEDPSISIGKKSWPSMYPNWPSGFWIGDIGLDNLISEDEDSPYASVFLNPPKSLGFDLQKAAKRLREFAKTILTTEQMGCMGEEVNKTDASMYFLLPDPREELMQLLIENKSTLFIDRMVSHFEILTKFIPVMDELLLGSKRK